MPLFEAPEEVNQMCGIVIFAGHEVTSSHVQPFDMGEQMPESVFDLCQSLFEVVGGRLAEGVEMKPLHSLRKFRQLVGGYS